MDRRVILLCASAIPLGLAAGYAWSAITAPPPRAHVPPKATIADVPASPEEYPAALDEDWSARGDDRPRPSTAAAAAAPGSQSVGQSVQRSGCNDVRVGEPGYREEMDGDADGIACEPRPRQ
jgi:hypothetical protein